MMRISKRQFLAGSAGGAGAMLAAGTLTNWLVRPPKARLAIFDSRLDVGRRFAAQARDAGIPTLDLAKADEAFWACARHGLGLNPGDRTIGVTGWDDWVVLRAQFAERRLRVRREVRLDCCGSVDAEHDLVHLAASHHDQGRRIAVAGARGTAFAWHVA